MSAVLAIGLIMVAHAQSQDERSPSNLVRGVNRGTLDSSAGKQYWTFDAAPGEFQLVFGGGGPEEMLPAAHPPRVTVAFLPPLDAASTFTRRSIPGGGTVFKGSVGQRTRVNVTVEPEKTRERMLIDYTLVATGSIQ